MIELPEIQKTKSGTNKYFIPLILLIVFGGSGYFLYTSFFNGFTVSSNKPTQSGSGEETQFADFGERVAIALNNINFANQSQQRQDVAGFLSDDLVTAYQKYFYDPDFQRLIADRRIYVTFQKIQRTSVENLKPDSAVVRVTGFDTFRSDVSKTQKEVPFTLLLFVEKKQDGALVCSKIKKL